jgi:arginase
MTHHDLAMTLYQGRAGDRNSRGMAGAAVLCTALETFTGQKAVTVGQPAEPIGLRWDGELAAARTALQALAVRYEAVFHAGQAPLTCMGRCAAALATLPVVARHRPDACIVWFDAHADANTPDTSASGYLGGLVLTGAAGQWNSGLGDGLQLGSVVLVGARDIDPAEQALIDSGVLRLVPPGEALAERLCAVVGHAPVYVHLDCDVLDPGIVPTEYQVPGGLSLVALQQALAGLARNEIIGFEIAEFEAHWAAGGGAAMPEVLLPALAPLLQAMADR